MFKSLVARYVYHRVWNRLCNKVRYQTWVVMRKALQHKMRNTPVTRIKTKAVIA